MLVLVAISMVAICAVAGFAVDVGSWYQAHRSQQAIVDSAALAAVGDLPANTDQATTDAQAYAAKNGGATSSISFSTKYLPDDTVTVQTQATAPSHFLGVIGIQSAEVGATAVARADNLGAAYGSAPFGVINTQPELAGSGCPCFGVSTTLDLNKVGPGGFGIINIDGSSGGTSPGTLASWITQGCGCTTAAPVWLNSDPGAKFNSSQVKGAMDQMIGHTLLFPVYDQTQGNGVRPPVPRDRLRRLHRHRLHLQGQQWDDHRVLHQGRLGRRRHHRHDDLLRRHHKPTHRQPQRPLTALEAPDRTT